LLFGFVVASLAIVFWSAYDIAVGGLEREPSFLAEAISGEIAGAIAALIGALLLRRFVDRRSVASLGLWLRRPWLRLFLLGLVFGTGMQTIVFCMELLFGGIRTDGFGPLVSDVRLLAAGLGVFAAGALFEEVCFRGYLFQNFWEAFGLWPAVITTSLLFAGLHLGNPNAFALPLPTFTGLLFFSLWACCSVLWTKSLWLGLGAHLSWNLFEGPVFGFPVSGLVMPVKTIVLQNTIGPAWLTGGAFGPEAGLSSLVAMAIGLGILRWLYRSGVFAGVPDVRESYARG